MRVVLGGCFVLKRRKRSRAGFGVGADIVVRGEIVEDLQAVLAALTCGLSLAVGARVCGDNEIAGFDAPRERFALRDPVV